MFRYSRESDVFSYGVVIAQLVTGRSPADQFVVENGGSIGQWLHKCLQSSDGAMEAIDPALRSSGYVSEILRAMEVAVSCTNRRPTQRPTSTAALKMLLQIRNPDTVPGKDHRRRRLNQHLSHSHAQISGHRVHQV
jgi:serine/threonine protein kinase